MDRGYSSGFSGWGGSGGGGSSRGSGGYDLYGYKDSMSSSGGFGGGGYGSSDRMKRGLSGGSLLSSSGSNADDVIAKINQRLDMLTQLEGGMKSGARGDRFAQYESFDSRSTSLGPRDLYRSGSFGFSDSRGDMMAQRGGVGFGVMGGAGGGGFDGSAFGSAKMRLTRDSAFSGSGWGAEQRSPRRNRSAGGRGFGRRQDSSSSAAGMGGGSGRGGGHQGHSPAGRGKLPSLLANRMYPDSGAFQSQRGPQDFPARNFGGGPRANRQHGRKRPQNRVSTARSLQGAGLRDQRSPLHIGSSQAHSFHQPSRRGYPSLTQVKAQRDGQKKRKQTLSATDEPESKMGKTEAAGEASASDAVAGEQTQESEEATAATAVESKTEDGGESAAPSNQDESAKAKGKKTPPSAAKARKRRGFFERSGVKVSAHRMTFACSVCKFRSFYSEDMAVHLESKFHKDHFKFLSNQLSKPTTDFLQVRTLQANSYLESSVNRSPVRFAWIRGVGGLNEASYKSVLLINFRNIVLFVHLRVRFVVSQGEDPFNGNQDDQDPEDSMVMEVSEADLTNESLNEIKQEEEGPLAEGAEPTAEADGNGEEHEEEVKMETGGAAEEVEEGVEGVEVGEEEAAEHGVDAGAAGDADAAAAE
ncbi:A-kinase anchor protein 8-like [Sinocyclocheilus anshuiensis]|uniref:A-kinase anchor protein 8-like n=1 Tax=Sinocyclocheilus anshuiensis TaxID=1608454 RepID=UPI0007B8BE3B|nr:PREDICTED: A-kinase anchor protein 8-like [Sinocyclocheilus anshuiensis]